MTRFQTKCLLASSLAHGFGLLLLFIIPALFLAKQIPLPAETITLMRITDLPSHGGNPNVTPPPATTVVTPPAAARTTPTPQVVKPPETRSTPAVVTPTPVPRETHRETPRVRPTETEKPDIQVREQAKPTKKPEPETGTRTQNTTPAPRRSFDLSSAVERDTAQIARERQQAAREQEQRQWRQKTTEIAKSLEGASTAIREKSSTATTVEVPGQGGAFYANYTSVINGLYKIKYHEAMKKVGDIARGTSAAQVIIVIQKDGTVRTSRISRNSGNADLDRVVQRVLNEVNYVAPFPEGAKDEEREFKITFELQPQTDLG
jgi:TonB family protein